jgi:hypothetical protein
VALPIQLQNPRAGLGGVSGADTLTGSGGGLGVQLDEALQGGPSMDLMALGTGRRLTLRSQAVELVNGIDGVRKNMMAQVLDSMKG